MRKLSIIVVFLTSYYANCQRSIVAESINDGKLYNLDTNQIVSDTISAKLSIDFNNFTVNLVRNNINETYLIEEDHSQVITEEGVSKLCNYIICGNALQKISIVYDYSNDPIAILFMPEKKYVLYVYPNKT